eukprot:gene15845-21972_t
MLATQLMLLAALVLVGLSKAGLLSPTKLVLSVSAGNASVTADAANCQGGPVRWAPTSQPAGLVRTGRTQATAADSVVSVAAGAIFGEGWPLWASVFGCAAIGHLAEEHTWIGEKLSAPLVSMLFAVALSATGIIPADCTSYNVVWKYMMPMAASCFLLNTDLGKLASTGGATMAAFLVGSVGMMLGAVIGWWAFRHQLGPEGGKLAAALCSSYVGGSVNFCAVATAVNLDPIVIPAAMAADNLAMAAYLAVLMAVPTDTPGATLVKTSSTSGIDLQAEQNQLIKLMSNALAQALAALWQIQHLTLLLMSVLTIALSSSLRHLSTMSSQGQEGLDSGDAVFAVFSGVCQMWQIQGLTQLLISLITNALSSSLRHLSSMSFQGQEGHIQETLYLQGGPALGGRLVLIVFAIIGASAGFWSILPPNFPPNRIPCCSTLVGGLALGGPALGGGLMLIFFAIIGASAGSLSGLSLTWTLMGFMTVMVLVHWVVLIVGTTALGLPRNAVLLGSNACIGGPATATAMAQSKGWHHMVSPALLTGSLGYGIGTAAGFWAERHSFVIKWLLLADGTSRENIEGPASYLKDCGLKDTLSSSSGCFLPMEHLKVRSLG